jgi:hypothetical protein
MSLMHMDSIENGKRPRTKRGSAMASALLACAFALAGFTGCGHEPEAEPTVVIETPADGSTVAGPNVLVKVKTTHFTFTGAAAAKSSAAQHDDGDVSGHVHVFIDKPGLVDADAVTNLTKYDTATVLITQPGEHYIIVAGADAKHNDLESMRDSVKFTVTIP